MKIHTREPSINRNPRNGATPALPWRPGRFSIQRGALNLSPDDHYFFATIGQGRGWVLAIDTQRKTLASAFSSTPLSEDSIGGVWGSTGVSIDAHGDIYAVSGASGSERHAPPMRKAISANCWREQIRYNSTIHTRPLMIRMD